MSIALILTILKTLFSIVTNKWTYFILLMIICFLTISYLIVENKKKDKDIINLSNEITNLSISNALLNDDILKISILYRPHSYNKYRSFDKLLLLQYY